MEEGSEDRRPTDDASSEAEAQNALFAAIAKAAANAETAEDLLTLAFAYDKIIGGDSSPEQPERDPYCTGATQMLEYDPKGLEEDRARIGFGPR